MKTITRSNIYLPMAALILAALAIPAAAQTQVPFKGTFQGNDTVAPPHDHYKRHGNWDADGRILIDPRPFISHRNRACSLGGGQWGYDRFDIRIVARL